MWRRGCTDRRRGFVPGAIERWRGVRRLALERSKGMASLVMTKKISSAAGSVRTGKSAEKLFQKGSVRDRVSRFLETPKRYSDFVKYVNRLGADPPRLLRYLRKNGLVREEDGTLWMK